MIYLSGHVCADILGQPHLGALLTPNMGQRPDLSATPWGADTGCFSQGDSFRLGAYLAWLESMDAYRATCHFATAPDVVRHIGKRVVGDAVATWERSRHVLPVLREMGWPAALVGQDGLEHLRVEWDAFDVLFLGGSTAWKLAPTTAKLVGEAKTRGKYVHMGRVNAGGRLRYAHDIGCDSADGTFLKFGPDTNKPRMLGWLEKLARQPGIWGADDVRRIGYGEHRTGKYRVSVAEACASAGQELRDLMRRMAAIQRDVPLYEQAQWVELLMQTSDLAEQWGDWGEWAATDEAADLTG